MATSTGAAPESFIRPRPGVVRTLGVLNLAFSALIIANVAFSVIGLVLFSNAKIDPAWAHPSGATGPAAAARPEPIAAFGLDDPAMIRFTIVDAATALVLNALMFAAGLGLLNRRAWGARWSAGVAWAKIVRLVAAWVAFIALVVPSLSRRAALYFIMTSPVPPAKGVPLDRLSGTLAVMLVILAVAEIVLGVIYPGAMLWTLGRPGVREALDGRPGLAEGSPT